MKKRTANLLYAAIGSAIVSAPVFAAQTLSEGLTTGSTIKVNVRSRYESVDWDGLKDSDALTVRSRLTYQSGNWNGFGLGLEMDNVTDATADVDYRTWPKDPTNAGTAIISDPEGTDLNQAFVQYATFNNTVKAGRQRIVLDNSRFIGNVGWRQNEQTYDGVSLTNKSIRYTNIFVAHITNVNRIFGNTTPLQGDYKQDTNLLNVSYTGFEAGKLTGYAYLLDNVSDPYLVAAAASKGAAIGNKTYGVRWSSTANTSFMYTLEYAKQENAYDNLIEYSTDYKFAEVSTTIGRFTPAVGYEVLGSDGSVKGFATPFATLHVFNGWADRFLTTPKAGLKDLYFNLGVTVAKAQLMASYHKFSSDEKVLDDKTMPTYGKSVDYGTELDLSASRKFGGVTYTAKYAMFSNDGLYEKIGTKWLASDTTKIWFQADWNF